MQQYSNFVNEQARLPIRFEMKRYKQTRVTKKNKKKSTLNTVKALDKQCYKLHMYADGCVRIQANRKHKQTVRTH